MSILTVEEARAYSRDYESPESEMERLIAFTEDYLEGAIGKGCDKTSPRVKQLAGMFLTDADDNRGTSGAEDNSRRLLTASLLLQLQMEYGGPVSESDTGAGGEQGAEP